MEGMIDIPTFYGRLKAETVRLELSAKQFLYDTSFYGQPKDKCLELTLIEAAYLIYKGRIIVTWTGDELDFETFMCEASHRMKNFEVKYIVYKDLRERGYFIKHGVTDFRVYPRGGRPGKTPSKYFVYVLSERQPMPLLDLIRQVEAAGNVRKELVMAVVDEESDITFYGAHLRSMKGDMENESENSSIKATLLEDRVIVWDSEASSRLHNVYFYGKPLDELRLQLSLIEAAYLQDRNIIDLRDSKADRVLTRDEFIEQAVVVEPDFLKKLSVYKDLRDSGMVVKTGYKFGSHYRVYKNIDPKKGMRHSEFLVHALDSDHIFNLSQLSRAVRLAHSVRKQMVFAWQAGQGIHYLEISRMKM
jgi:tRNA-intron endonuclease